MPRGEGHSLPKDVHQSPSRQQVDTEAALDSILLDCVEGFMQDLINDAVAEDDDLILDEFLDSDDEDVFEACAVAVATSAVEAANPQEPAPEAKPIMNTVAEDDSDVSDHEQVYTFEGDDVEDDPEIEAFEFAHMAFGYARSAVSAGLAHAAFFATEDADAGDAEEEGDAQVVAQESEMPTAAPANHEQPKVAFHLRPSVGSWLRPLPPVREAPTAVPAEQETPKVAFHLRPSVGSWLRPLPRVREAPTAAPAEQVTPKVAFHLRPSVGSWLRPAPRAIPAVASAKAAAGAASVETVAAPAVAVAPETEAAPEEAAAPEVVVPEVEEFLLEEQEMRERAEADASNVVEEFLLEQAAEPKARPFPKERRVLELPLQAATSEPRTQASEASPPTARRNSDVAKHSRHRTIIGGVVRESGQQHPAALSTSPKAPGWALSSSVDPSSPVSGGARRQLPHCAGSATGTVRQARRMAASQKELGTSVFRMDSDTEEVPKASRRQSSLAAAYDALGAELHSLDQECDRPASPALRAKHGAKPASKAEQRGSPFSRTASSIVLEESTRRASDAGLAQTGPEQSPKSSRGGRRSRVTLRASPSAMELDLADGAAPRGAQLAAPSREQLATVGSLQPLFKSKPAGALPTVNAKLGASDWSMGGAADKRWIGASPGAF